MLIDYSCKLLTVTLSICPDSYRVIQITCTHEFMNFCTGKPVVVQELNYDEELLELYLSLILSSKGIANYCVRVTVCMCKWVCVRTHRVCVQAGVCWYMCVCALCVCKRSLG